MDEHDLATGPLELLEQEDLIDVLPRQAIWTEHDDGTDLTVLDSVTQTIQPWPVEPRAAVALVEEDVLGCNRMTIRFGPGSQNGKLALDRLPTFLALSRHACVDLGVHRIIKEKSTGLVSTQRPPHPTTTDKKHAHALAH